MWPERWQEFIRERTLDLIKIIVLMTRCLSAILEAPTSLFMPIRMVKLSGYLILGLLDPVLLPISLFYSLLIISNESTSRYIDTFYCKILKIILMSSDNEQLSTYHVSNTNFMSM